MATRRIGKHVSTDEETWAMLAEIATARGITPSAAINRWIHAEHARLQERKEEVSHGQT